MTQRSSSDSGSFQDARGTPTAASGRSLWKWLTGLFRKAPPPAWQEQQVEQALVAIPEQELPEPLELGRHGRLILASVSVEAMREARSAMDKALAQATTLVDNGNARSLIIGVVDNDGVLRPAVVSCVGAFELLGAAAAINAIIVDSMSEG